MVTSIQFSNLSFTDENWVVSKILEEWKVEYLKKPIFENLRKVQRENKECVKVIDKFFYLHSSPILMSKATNIAPLYIHPIILTKRYLNFIFFLLHVHCTNIDLSFLNYSTYKNNIAYPSLFTLLSKKVTNFVSIAKRKRLIFIDIATYWDSCTQITLKNGAHKPVAESHFKIGCYNKYYLSLSTFITNYSGIHTYIQSTKIWLVPPKWEIIMVISNFLI